MTKDIIIIGAGGHARSVTESVMANGYNIICYVDKNKFNDSLFSLPIKINLMIDKNEEVNILIAIANNYIREKIYKDIIEKYNKVMFPNIIDPTAKISKYAKIGKGNMIMVNAFIGANTHITNFCIINNNASIDHDCSVKKFSSLAPSVSTGGNVKIGSRSAIGIGAIIKNNISIGQDTLIGASSYLNINANKSSVYYGNPAKFIKKVVSIDE